LETLEREMQARELANMALTASSVAESLGFEETAKAFASIAADAYLLPQGNEADPIDREVRTTNWMNARNGKFLYT
jgi:hypothetical protein